MSSRNVGEALIKCLESIENMSPEEQKQFVEDLWDFVKKSREEDRTSTEKYLDKLEEQNALSAPVLAQIKRLAKVVEVEPMIFPLNHNRAALEYQKPLTGEYLRFVSSGGHLVKYTEMHPSKKTIDDYIRERDIPDKVNKFFARK